MFQLDLDEKWFDVKKTATFDFFFTTVSRTTISEDIEQRINWHFISIVLNALDVYKRQ